MDNIKYLFFDWGDTLMIDYPQYSGPMVTWPHITPMKGAAELLPTLAEKYTCVVVSNATESNAELMERAFEKVGLSGYFSLFVTSKELGSMKPDPGFFSKALLCLGATPGEAVMIGNDYKKDIEPAKSIGMHTVLIAEASGDLSCADHVVADFSELSSVL